MLGLQTVPASPSAMKGIVHAFAPVYDPSCVSFNIMFDIALLL